MVWKRRKSRARVTTHSRDRFPHLRVRVALTNDHLALPVELVIVEGADERLELLGDGLRVLLLLRTPFFCGTSAV